MLTQQYALLSIVWMIGFVMLFDRVHSRRRHYQYLWDMYKMVLAGNLAGME
jgi:predicted tellurium resistance membrane protein TerC